MFVEPISLSGKYVRLEPIAEKHAEELWKVGSDPKIWRFMPQVPTSQEVLIELIRGAIKMSEHGMGLGLVLIDQSTNHAIGSSGYWNLAPEHLRLEIGMTWIAPTWQRTVANTEMKLLMLTHAFESIGCERVEFKTDARNERSRKALKRIGAIEEGTLRNHMQYVNGERRDSVYFSILRSEWTDRKEELSEKIRERS